MASGYCGRILHIDLGKRTIEIEEPGDAFYRKYLGGKGFVSYYLLKCMTQGVDPLGPENVLVFASGVMAGTSVPGFSRVVVGAKSPLTNGYCESEVGGSWGMELKRAGYDALIVHGSSATPVVVTISGGQVRIRDAAELWGLSTRECEKRIAADFAKKPAVMTIGPAGERLVRFACVMQGERNAAGRGGLGAVMGSKRLKAIAVSGSGKVEVKDDSVLKGIAAWFMTNAKTNGPSVALLESGTAGVVGGLQAQSLLPTKNFSRGRFTQWGELAKLAKGWVYEMRPRGCWGCPIRCKNAYRVTDGSLPADSDGTVAGPEYESVAAFGSNLCVDDPLTVIKANLYCNDMGMDTISAGATIAFALDCIEQGLLEDPVLREIDARFGNAACVLPLLEMICERKGIGDVLAEGSLVASCKIGKGSQRYAMHVKGLELGMHDPRGKPGLGLGYAVADHGADHMTALHDTLFAREGAYGLETGGPLGILDPEPATSLGPRKVRLYLYTQMWWDALKCLGACFFTVAPRGLMPIGMVIEGVRGSTGWDFSLWEAMKAGDRAACMARAFNIREGYGAERDTLPPRLYEKSGEAGEGYPGIDPSAMDEAIRLYYEMRGWDRETGSPGFARLQELGIEWVIDAMGKQG